MYRYTNTCTHICIDTSTYRYRHMHTDIYKYTCRHTQTHMHIFYIHKHIYIYIYVRSTLPAHFIFSCHLPNELRSPWTYFITSFSAISNFRFKLIKLMTTLIQSSPICSCNPINIRLRAMPLAVSSVTLLFNCSNC